MTIWASANLQDNGIEYLADTATFLTLVSSYTAGDSVATVATNTVAEVAMATGDFTLSTPSAGVRRVTSAAKTGVAASETIPAGEDTHFVFRSTTEVIYVTKESTEQAITVGNPLNFPTLYLETPQPTAV